MLNRFTQVSVRDSDKEWQTFTLDQIDRICYITIGCVTKGFDLNDIATMDKPWYIPEPDGGWQTEFTPVERQKYRQMAETIAMMDGNAFFGAETDDNGDDTWYYAYLPYAAALYANNGGDDGWAGESSINKQGD